MTYDVSVYDDSTILQAIDRRLARGCIDDLLLSLEDELIKRYKTPEPVVVVAPKPMPRIHTYSGCGSKLIQSQKDLICKMRQSGHTHKEMALAAKCSVRSVQRVLNDALLTDFSNKVSYDVETMDKIVNLSNRGKSVREICNIMNMDNDVVRRWINKSRSRAK